MDPIICFALPRSGSTLFMRLMRQCLAEDGSSVMFTGETSLLWQTVPVYSKLRRLQRRQDNRKDPELKFAPHYFQGSTAKAVASLGDVYRQINGCSAEQAWGFKEVNYGLHEDSFKELLAVLVEIFPAVRFVFLTREREAVINSMCRDGWWIERSRPDVSDRVDRQVANYRAAASDYSARSTLLDYDAVLSLDTFSVFLDGLGLSIKPEAFNTVVAKRLR